MTDEQQISGTNWSYQNWMETLPDRDLSVASLTIPGTHNSGATHGGPGDAARCQTLSIRSQLDHGIRFFDIRCKVRNSGNDRYFQVYHGLIDQHLTFGGNVLQPIDEFLKEHPGEVVLMRIRKEDDNASASDFNSTFWNIYINNDGWSRLFHISPALPTVNEAAGKIVPFCGDIEGLMSPGVFNRQDQYDVIESRKINAIKQHFIDAANHPEQAYMNMLNLQFDMTGMHDPEYFAGRINPLIRDYIANDLYDKWNSAFTLPALGIVGMDYPEKAGWERQGSSAGLVGRLINWNYFRNYAPSLERPSITTCVASLIQDGRVKGIIVEGTAEQRSRTISIAGSVSGQTAVVNGHWSISFETNLAADPRPEVIVTAVGYDNVPSSAPVSTSLRTPLLTVISPPLFGTIKRPFGEPIVVSGVGLPGGIIDLTLTTPFLVFPNTREVKVNPDGTWRAEFDFSWAIIPYYGTAKLRGSTELGSTQPISFAVIGK